MSTVFKEVIERFPIFRAVLTVLRCGLLEIGLKERLRILAASGIDFHVGERVALLRKPIPEFRSGQRLCFAERNNLLLQCHGIGL